MDKEEMVFGQAGGRELTFEVGRGCRGELKLGGRVRRGSEVWEHAESVTTRRIGLGA